MNIDTILAPGFTMTKDNALGVMRFMMDVNKPDGQDVRNYLLTAPEADLIMALRIGFDAAETENDQDWCYFMHNLMENRGVTFEMLGRQMPDTLARLYHVERQVEKLNAVMGVAEAADKWGLEHSTIKKMCQKGQIIARKVGDTWIMPADHDRPSAQRDRFVWQDHIHVGSQPGSLKNYEQLDLEGLYVKVASMIIKIQDITLKINRRAMRGDAVQKLSIITDCEKFFISAGTTDTDQQIKDRVIDKVAKMIDHLQKK